MYLDHIFILTEPGAPQAQRLSALGLREGNPNTHPGQGTSNRRFFVDNFKIELVFLSDLDEAANGTGKGLGILARSRDVSASPFGIIVRVNDPNTTPDFPSWQYFPDYFPDDWCFYVGENSDQLEEPLCLCMPPALPKPQEVLDEYANPDWKLTELKVQVPVQQFSTTLREFAAIQNITVESGTTHRMTMRFNDGEAGRSEDLRPDLPLIMEW